MKIQEFKPIEMIRSNEQHLGNSKVTPLTYKKPGLTPITSIKPVEQDTEAAALTRTGKTADGKSFEDYLMEAVSKVNSQQMDVSNLQQKIITNPDEVDIHDVTIAMSKARMSLNLAQTVIDRLVTGWNEISTTR